MSTSPVSGSSSSSSSSTSTNTLNNLTPTDFMKMLVAELQDQDPTQPVSNTEILQEVSQIDSVESNQQLSTTLSSVLSGQNLATASNLLQKSVAATTSSGASISGTVTGVEVTNGNPQLYINGQLIDLSSVTAIQ